MSDLQTPKAPSPLLAMAEMARTSVEVSSLLFSGPLLAGAPEGDGHDVVVLPGFMFNHHTTLPLRNFLCWLGYRTHDWGFGFNLGARSIGAAGEILKERLDTLCDGGRRKVSLVGHSLGGVMAREYALRHPDYVRQVICLGSPFIHDPRGVNPAVSSLHEAITGHSSAVWPGEPHRNPPFSFTAIFSRTDGIVAPEVCTERVSRRAENIEVFGSHCGLVANPAAIYAIADRLARKDGDLSHFQPRGWRKRLYGRPEQQQAPQFRVVAA